jgi:biopolymer transport protein ExbB/TolQ
MFMNADPIVQAVMILLLLASISTWVVILEKTALIKRASRVVWMFKRKASDVLGKIDPEEFPGFTSDIVRAGLYEGQDLAGGEDRYDYRERLERTMREILAGRVTRLENRVTFLATVGSTSPFIGLFGTVWGIMHSFIGIASSGETTLAVVAPGIAEALFATAMGLCAAIPAVVAYNKINTNLLKLTKEAVSAIAIMGNSIARLHFEESETNAESDALSSASLS